MNVEENESIEISPLVDKVVFGGLYAYNHSMIPSTKRNINDQQYHQAVPTVDKNGALWMIDTYMLHSRPYRDNQYNEYVEWLKTLSDPKNGQYALSQRRNYFFENAEMITSEKILDNYELVCNLSSWRPVDYLDEVEQYDDVRCNVRLWNECKYPQGYALVRKDAVKSNALVLNNAVEKFVKSMNGYVNPGSGYLFDEMKERYEQCKADNTKLPMSLEVKYDNCLKMHDKLLKMKEEMEAFKKRLPSMEYKYSFFDDSVEVRDVHPDVERYLQNDCYCPNEVYGPNGFGYYLCGPDDKCAVLKRDHVNHRVWIVYVPKVTVYPRLIAFTLTDNEENVEDATFFDVTPTNIALMNREGNTYNTYAKLVYEDEVDALINSAMEKES